MTPDSLVIHNQQFEEIRQVIQYYSGYLVWYGLGAAALYIVSYLLKDNLKEYVSGRKWQRNVEYRRLDPVHFLDYKKVGVIEYIASVETAFTLYDILDNGDIVGGLSIVIPNAELQKMRIARFKPSLGTPANMPPFARGEAAPLNKADQLTPNRGTQN